MGTETSEQQKQREYKDRTKNISADRLTTYELYSLRLAITELSANLGKREALIETALREGLAAVALAASTPEDNSAAVQEQINKFTDELKSTTNAIDAAVRSNQS